MITPQKQIVVQDVLQQIIDNLPEFQINETDTGKVYFDFGSKERINEYIKATQGNNYPLIWLLPDKNDNNTSSNIVTRKISIIVSSIENRLELPNKDRIEDTFKKTLFPIRDYLVHSLRNSGATKLKDSLVRTYEFPRYILKDDEGTIDNWDAIRIECDVDFIRDKCIKSFTWTT